MPDLFGNLVNFSLTTSHSVREWRHVSTFNLLLLLPGTQRRLPETYPLLELFVDGHGRLHTVGRLCNLQQRVYPGRWQPRVNPPQQPQEVPSHVIATDAGEEELVKHGGTEVFLLKLLLFGGE